MTAEQALIEENKKDPRVRYVSYNTIGKVLTFWNKKPEYNESKKSFLDYSYISHIEEFNLIGCKNFILCIDDITPEVLPIPEKWYIECTKENRDILNRWRLTKARYYILDCYFSSGSILFSDDSISKDGSYYYFGGLPKNNQKIDDYQEITLEQFKKYVLGSEENQEEIQKPNNFKLSSIPYVTGRIGSVDMNGAPFSNTNNDISFDFYDTKYWIEDRINYINLFIKINIDSDLCINPDWLSERNKLIEQLKNL